MRSLVPAPLWETDRPGHERNWDIKFQLCVVLFTRISFKVNQTNLATNALRDRSLSSC